MATLREIQVIEKSGYALYYDAVGPRDGVLIVFLHPAFGDHRCFMRQVEAFAPHYRVITLDMLGHGRSQVADSRVTIERTSDLVLEILEREGRQHCHLVGVSLGSLIAQDLAARFPARVQTLTVVGGYSIFGDTREVRRAQAREMLKWLVLIAVSMPRFRRYIARTSTLLPASREAFYQSATMFTRRSLRVFSGLGKVMRNQPGGLRQPLLIVTGDHDLPLVQRLARAWHAQAPGSQLEVIPHAGHCANMDNPEHFNRRLEAFITAAGA